MNIEDIELIHIPEIKENGSIRRHPGTIIKVTLENKKIININLQKDINNEHKFFEPCWGVETKSLIQAIEEILSLEYNYEKHMEKEKQLLQ